MEIRDKAELKRRIGDRIKFLREKNKFTQEELAVKMGFKDKQVINRYEKSGGNPTIYSLLLICDALDISIATFFDFSEGETNDSGE